MDPVKYDRHYRDDPAACGEPFAEIVTFCGEVAPGSVLDLGCGQGRDALLFARAGHRVVGVDLSSVGVAQMLATARSEQLDVVGIVADVRAWRPDTSFDIVVLDRVLHMLDEVDRLPTLAHAMQAVSPGGFLIVAEGPGGMVTVRRAVEEAGWAVHRATRNRLFAGRR
ncbi:MAG: class I SAM-dependent methyltransferase [Alphaproteobacteria bacterium]|nr:class I SAM-dependent methyltransferase [Alphaproteobacteria bacterium]